MDGVVSDHATKHVPLDKVTLSLTFLGTSSGVPTVDRNVSSVALHWSPKDVYLIDCGDGTQRQLLSAHIPFARIRGLFITHLHGDHVYGLVPLLAMISMTCPTTTHLFVVGPQGLRKYVDDASRSTELYLKFELQIVELAHGATSRVALPSFAAQVFEITACPLKHRIPCFGYVFREPERREFDPRFAQDQRGVDARDLGKLARGERVVTSKGELVVRSDCMGDVIPGRVLVILGDTSNSDAIIPVVGEGGCDLLVHECTYDDSLVEKAASTGHSTSRDAGLFALRLGARRLVVTHFSARYATGDAPLPLRRDSDEQPKNTANLLAEAAAAATEKVICEEARDLKVVSVAPRKRLK